MRVTEDELSILCLLREMDKMQLSHITILLEMKLDEIAEQNERLEKMGLNDLMSNKLESALCDFATRLRNLIY